MEITHGSQMEFKSIGLNHRGGGLQFKHLSLGVEGTPDNYGFSLAKQHDFSSPVHHHNFDQFRYVLKGNIDLGPGMLLREGCLSHHSEGAYYGPQKDDGDQERIVLVLQCGGASGQGYLSFDQLEAANLELSRSGKFEAGKYHGPDGAIVDGYQALWEHVNKRKLVYPKARYQYPVLIDPAAFVWKHSGTDGIYTKLLGVFTERRLKAEQILVEHGTFHAGGNNAIHLLFVLDGTGQVGPENLTKESTISLQAGSAVTISGRSLLMLHYELPLVR